MKEKEINKLRKENLKGNYSQVEVIVGADTSIPYVAITKNHCTTEEVLKTVIILKYILDMLYKDLEEKDVNVKKTLKSIKYHIGKTGVE